MQILTSKEYLTYDDVLLVPQRSSIKSRKEISLDPKGRLANTIPIISANMDTVTEENMAIFMHAWGGLGIVHRFLSPTRLKEIIARCRAAGGFTPAVSVGINGDSDDLLEVALNARTKIYCIDVAHGHHDGVLDRISQLRSLTTNIEGATIIAGNVATTQACDDLISAGADVIKIGIGPGSHCTTRIVTGHGVPQLSALLECCEFVRSVGKESIADGGIRNSGDIAKALAAGATYVMLGRLLAGTDEAPGERVNRNGRWYKSYRGMASFEAQSDRGDFKAHRSTEGVSSLVEYTGSVIHTLSRMVNGLTSALSYTGARTLSEFRDKATFIRITHNSYIEGTPHGKGI
jgi:IMP dehydrogenase